MDSLLPWLPLLNILVVPVFVAYVKTEIRLVKLEDHKERVEIHLGFNERRISHGKET